MTEPCDFAIERMTINADPDHPRIERCVFPAGHDGPHRIGAPPDDGRPNHANPEAT